MNPNSDIPARVAAPDQCPEDVDCERDLRVRTFDFDPEPSVDVEKGRPDRIEPAGPTAEAVCLIHGIVWSRP